MTARTPQMEGFGRLTGSAAGQEQMQLFAFFLTQVAQAT